jgi:hypothetical protein
MVDVENLVGGANISCVELAEAVRGYRESAPVSRGDHVIVGVGPTLLIAAGLAWPHARIVLGRGPSGADHALLASVPDAQWVAARFDRVILGSGDGIFVGLLVSLRRLGIAVGVVAATGSISWQLRRHAHFVRTVGCKRHSLGAA